MSERDFGRPDDNHNPDDSNDDDQEDKPMTTPEPLTPDEQPGPDRALEAPKSDRLDVETPSAGQLFAMFPDAIPRNTPDRRRRHLAAVPDPSDLATLPGNTIEDDLDDPLLDTALRLRAWLVFWWRPAATGAVVVVIAVCAFLTAGAAIGIAWCVYGTGWSAYTIWQNHGRPSMRQIYQQRRGGIR
ncbi:hypothetical protein [Nocardia goodfellowii]|uniref:DUF3040 domain-containing protein n=1 Tax=Nocardia goodfellowii TaxID=882446 RepID=A0ABS4QPD8_9NOCA|nr:hypothetical protein [Nocardia goodfellowii]MBP2193581.1 hypothetical protein [Nocardia goodfellowii]